MDGTILLLGIIILLALYVLVRSFLSFIRDDSSKQEDKKQASQLPQTMISSQLSKTAQEAGGATKTIGRSTAESTTEPALTQARTEQIKPEAGSEEAKPAASAKKASKPAMPPIRTQGPTEEQSERIEKIERILVESFKNRSLRVVHGTGGNADNVRDINSAS
ncbi:MAG: hypothetical protein K6T91_04145 [Firmicutes bacterium]|nr:hypothetical protein [Bacillota bacterium]